MPLAKSACVGLHEMPRFVGSLTDRPASDRAPWRGMRGCRAWRNHFGLLSVGGSAIEYGRAAENRGPVFTDPQELYSCAVRAGRSAVEMAFGTSGVATAGPVCPPPHGRPPGSQRRGGLTHIPSSMHVPTAKAILVGRGSGRGGRRERIDPVGPRSARPLWR